MSREATTRPGETSGSRADSQRSCALAELSWREVEEALSRDSRLIFPVGALEQHGPHLPLGTNAYIVERLAEDLSELEGVLRAPPFFYGVTVPGGERFRGTATLRRKTFHRAVNELLASWEDHGVTEFIVLTAHRYEPHLDALLMALTETSATTVVDLYAIDISDLVDGVPDREHAAEVETSLLLHLDPSRVRRGLIENEGLDSEPYGRYVRARMATPPAGASGVFGRPSRASAEKGRAIYDRYVERIRATVLHNAQE